MEELGEAMLHEQQRREYAKKRQRLRLPARNPSELHVPSSLYVRSPSYRESRDVRQVSGVFLLRLLLRGVRGILGQSGARAVNHVDPIVECVGELGHEVLQRPVLEAPA